MEAKDLMIGDYLMYDNMPYRVVQIEDVLQEGWMLENGVEDCGAPIPLTRDILEKNEFIGMPYAVLKIDDNSWLEYYYHEHRLIKWWSGIDEWENNSKVKDITFQCHCIYVHELQHTLRLCGIEKEIIL